MISTFFLLVRNVRRVNVCLLCDIEISILILWHTEMRAKNFYFILLCAFLQQYRIILLRLIHRVAHPLVIIKRKKPVPEWITMFYASSGLVLHEMSCLDFSRIRAREKGKQNATRPVTTAASSPLNSPRVTHPRSEVVAGCLKVVSAVTWRQDKIAHCAFCYFASGPLSPQRRPLPGYHVSGRCGRKTRSA